MLKVTLKFSLKVLGATPLIYMGMALGPVGAAVVLAVLAVTVVGEAAVMRAVHH